MTQTLKLGLLQMASAGDPEKNLKKTLERISEVASRGTQIICLQELFLTDYFCQTHDPRHFDLAEAVPGPTTHALSQLAKEKSIVVIAPLFEKRGEGIYHNSAVVIDADGRLAGKYRKMHIPDDPHFHEKFYFTPGDLGFRAFQTRYAKIGVLICWDQWFPEAARATALQGAQILFYPTAIGWHDSETAQDRRAQRTGWEIVQRGHSVANGVFVAVTNRVGKEGELAFWGSSFVSDPFGSVIGRAAKNKEANLIVDCDLSKIEQTRRSWPFLRDRRIDAYAAIQERFVDNVDQKIGSATPDIRRAKKKTAV